MRILGVLAALLIASPCMATTIIWDGHILAADSQSSMGHHKTLSARKIARSDARHASIATSGNALRAELVIQYFLSCTDPLSKMELPLPKDEDDAVYILVVFDSGVALFYGGDIAAISSVEAPFAMGTGGDIALGAVLSGKTAVQALEYSRDHDIFTGGAIKSIVAPDATHKLIDIDVKMPELVLPGTIVPKATK